MSQTTTTAVTESADREWVADLPRRKSYRWSVVGLVVGVVALGLATIPSIALERPIRNPFGEKKVEQSQEREGGLTVKFKGFSFNAGGKPVKKEIPEVKPAVTGDPVRWLTITAILCALLGLVAAAIGQIRERHSVLTTCAMTCCVAAVTWEYVVAGIIIGIATIVVLIVFMCLAQALGS